MRELAGGRTPKHSIDYRFDHHGREFEVPEHGAKVERCREHVHEQLDIDVCANFPSFYTPSNCGAYRASPLGEHFLANGPREYRVIRHFADEACQGGSQRTLEAGNEGFDGSHQIKAKRSGIRRRVRT